jgi:hypothetical protein
MTPAQKFNFFMPAWNKAVHANGWHTRDHAAAGVEATSAELLDLISIAKKFSMKERGTPFFTLRDLRHACTILCLGRDKDTDKLNNSEQDHIVALFHLLAQPMSIAARTKYDAYQRGENPGKKVRRQYFIKSRAPEAVLRHLTHDLTGGRTKDWESLEDSKQAELARLLKQRPIYGHSPRIQQEEAERAGKGSGSAASAVSCSKSGPKNYVLDPGKTFQQKQTKNTEPDPDWSVK